MADNTSILARYIQSGIPGIRWSTKKVWWGGAWGSFQFQALVNLPVGTNGRSSFSLSILESTVHDES